MKDTLILPSLQWHQLPLALQEQQYLTNRVLVQDKLPWISCYLDFSYLGQLGNFSFWV